MFHADDAILKTEYLANGGAALGKAIQADAETARKLEDALKIFGEMEEKAMAHIREALANISEGKK
jgi:transaldolase